MPRLFLRWLGLATWMCLASLPAAIGAPWTEAEKAALRSIRGTEALEVIKVLAADSMEGRGTGSKGERQAAEYIAGQFKKLGLEPLEDTKGFLQVYRLKKQDKQSQNVLGVLRGADPKLRDEVVVVGAHHDHVGFGKRGGSRLGGDDVGEIHNGADDNASGVAALLEIAAAFVEAKLKPKRTIVFATFSGEERGLTGSKHFVGSSLVPLERIVAMVNLDMVGRGETGTFQVYGLGTAELLASHAKAIELELEEDMGRTLKIRFGQSGAHASDNKPFNDRQIPVLLFHTGFHEQYHTPRDDWERINADNLEIVARMVFLVASRLASHDEKRPVYIGKD